MEIFDKFAYCKDPENYKYEEPEIHTSEPFPLPDATVPSPIEDDTITGPTIHPKYVFSLFPILLNLPTNDWINSDNICGYGSEVYDKLGIEFEECLCDLDQVKDGGACTKQDIKSNSKNRNFAKPIKVRHF